MCAERHEGLGSGSERPPRGVSRSAVAGAWPLYSAAFAMALSISMVWTAMPFVLTAMGGTEAHVGYAPAVNTLAYMLALFVTGSLLGHLKVKRAALSAAAVALAASVAMAVAVLGPRLAGSNGSRWWIWAVIVSGGIGGAAMALYWPFLMSWVSADYEGVRLNRRFGRYNAAWSSGAAVGPLVGAWLVETSPSLPVMAAAGFVLLSVLVLGLAQDSSIQTLLSPGVKDLACSPRMLADCRWTSRIALFSACLCFAMIRSQFALVFTGLGYAESQFGVYQMVYALCNVAVLAVAGRWALWHFKPVLLTIAQSLLLLTLLMVIYGRTLPVFFISAVLLGVAYGFAYSSHLYYGASTSRRRSVRMTIHEITISLGLTVGAAAGGYFCEHVGTYVPYWFAVAVVGLGLLMQAAIHLAAGAAPVVPPQAPPATAAEPVD
jgi:MFS family permease